MILVVLPATPAESFACNSGGGFSTLPVTPAESFVSGSGGEQLHVANRFLLDERHFRRAYLLYWWPQRKVLPVTPAEGFLFYL
jgi:hypothetical protein